VLAPGAEVEPDYSGALVYSDWSDAPNYRLLMRKAEQHRVHSIAFVRPVGYTWLTPLYSLALLTAAHLRKAGVALKLVTPEDSPLGIFGESSADRVRGLLRSHGVSLYLGAYTGPGPAGEVGIQPGHRRTAADRVVRAPRLIRRPIAGLPCTADSFLVTDRYSRVRGVDRVLAVGDATSFPVKDASIAVQQADVAAAYIANRTGARVATPMFRPCVHADLLTASGSVELHADLSGCNGDARADRQAAQPGTDRGRRFRRSPRPAADLLSR
jgi:sulfide:quinone oxidoreductase